MGGSWAVIEAIGKVTKTEHEESLFDNTPVTSARDPVLARAGGKDDEDPKKAF